MAGILYILGMGIINDRFSARRHLVRYIVANEVASGQDKRYEEGPEGGPPLAWNFFLLLVREIHRSKGLKKPSRAATPNGGFSSFHGQ